MIVLYRLNFLFLYFFLYLLDFFRSEFCLLPCCSYSGDLLSCSYYRGCIFLLSYLAMLTMIFSFESEILLFNLNSLTSELRSRKVGSASDIEHIMMLISLAWLTLRVMPLLCQWKVVGWRASELY